MKMNGKPLPGQSFHVDRGQLKNCLNVIYAVIKPWQTGNGSELDMLYEAIFSSLKHAVTLKAATVAIAGVSSGFPAGASCMTLLDAISFFCTKSQERMEIQLVDSSDQVVNYFHEFLGKSFGKDQVIIMDGEVQDVPAAVKKSTTNGKIMPSRIIYFYKCLFCNACIKSLASALRLS